MNAARLPAEQRFHIFMAAAIAACVLGGFSRTYFFKPFLAESASPLSPLSHIHGLLFNSWIVLLLLQVVLVSRRRFDLHRRLGLLGMALAAAMLVTGWTVSLVNAAEGRAVPGVPPFVFLGITLPDLLLFAVFVAAGYLSRRSAPASHKRWMLLATLAILTAATARFTRILFPSSQVPDLFMGWAVTDALVLVSIGFEWFKLRHMHPVTLWGGIALLLSEPLRLAIANTEAWLKAAQWMVDCVR